MIKAKLSIEVTNGNTFDSCEVEFDPSIWRSDQKFMTQVKNYKTTIKSLNRGWELEDNEDAAYLELTAIDTKDTRVCFMIDDMLDYLDE
jgi:hypothetical protein